MPTNAAKKSVLNQLMPCIVLFSAVLFSARYSATYTARASVISPVRVARNPSSA